MRTDVQPVLASMTSSCNRRGRCDTPRADLQLKRLAVAVQHNWQLVWRWPDSGNLRRASRRRSRRGCGPERAPPPAAQALIVRFWDCLALSGSCLGFVGLV